MKKAIEQAEARHKAACLDLIEAVKTCYPVGSHAYVSVSSRATVLVEVTGHSDSWWSDPGTIIGRNITTGAGHRFTPAQVVG